MNIRLAWFAAACLFTAAAALIWAGHPLVAAVLLMGVSYLAGRSDRRRDRRAAQAEVERWQAEADRLSDELIFHHSQRHADLCGDDTRMLPDLRDRPDWADLNRKPGITPVRGTSPSRAVSNP
ncbi:hypothetical protein AB0J14_04365 [Micromonospora arborensis]|uniref:hypothetical protein n=1 Tax=Micromonospora arborensis TaxID=2116518 RepID=UPI0033F48046